MCGIVGVLNLHEGRAIDETTLARMRDTLAHRGPDDTGLYRNPSGRLGFGFRRLSIQDLSPLGHQPMPEIDPATSRVWIVFNGEIYNFWELRSDLEKAGHTFRSRCDTEVLLRLYRAHGFPKMLSFLRGMFAIAIWDESEQTLFLARDRMGVKPLYTAFFDGAFVFGSEIKALLEHPSARRAVNVDAFYHYLSFLTTPAPDTLFDGVQKLPAGHWMSVRANGETRTAPYWDVFDNAELISPDTDPAKVAQAVREKLMESIRYRMVSDVPFGVFLSGGIDSSTNAAIMSHFLNGKPVESFSIGYKDGDRYNELEHARAVARYLKANHHEIIISKDDFQKFLWTLVHHQDEPIADPVCVPVYYVAKLARDSGVTVAQVGEGADELFCGYPYWKWMLRLQRMNRWPVPALAKRAAWSAMAAVGKGGGRLPEILRRGAYGENLFWGGAEAFSETAKKRLLSPALRQRFRDRSSHEVIAALRRRFEAGSPLKNDDLAWMGYLDLRLRLPELLLMRVDKMTMACSLEARVPFLDHKLVEYAMSIPQSIKMPGAVTKSVLKAAVRGLIPDQIIDRPKQGFGVPVQEWMAGLFGDFAREKLRGFCGRTDFFDRAAVDALLAEPQRMGFAIWYLLNFVLWHERWIENRTGETPA